ncbi:MAG TPA: GtrA family protein [Candidatus Saccharimonadales bacterium]|nr:GtrA family protein [Candidatus Saccharimonadales bacterium]
MPRSKLRSITIQFVEYLIGGGVYFWVGYGVFAICYSGLHWYWLWAKLLADVIGWTLGFFIQRYWAFRNPKLNKLNKAVTGRYIAITLFNFLIDYLIVGGLRALGVTPYIGLFVSSGFFTVWNYLWYRFWVFNPTIKTPNHNERND